MKIKLFKIISFLGLILLGQGCTGTQSSVNENASNPSVNEPPPLVVTPQSLINELNAMRANPRGYAQYLRQWLPYFQGNVLALPNQIRRQTSEGKNVVIETIQALDNHASLNALKTSSGLGKAATDHVRDQAKGATGHVGSDGSHVWDRADRYGKWNLEIGESIAYGRNDARGFILQLLVDDGVSDRGHRKTLLDGKWNLVGAATGSHARFNAMCVLVFATEYIEK
jgi:uncharacterized protein YkwD